MKYFSSKKQNLFITILISFVCLVIFHKSGVLDKAGMAAIVLNWLPIIIGFITIVIYFIANAVSRKYAWIVTVLGNVFNILITLKAFWSN